MAAAAQTLKRVFLELGGKSAFLVLDDADLDAACGFAAFSGIVHAGQGCALTTRILLPRDRFDDGVQILAATMTALGAGDPTDPSTVCGPLISARQRDRVEGYLRSAVDDGGSFVCGGRRPDRDRGFFVEPTLVVGVDNHATIAREEVFGPVLVASAVRRRRRRGPDRERLRLRVVRRRVRRRPRSCQCGGRSAADRHGRGERRPLVRGRRSVRRLQAVGNRPRDGCAGVRGVPRNQGDRDAGLREERVGRFDDKVAIVTGAARGIGEAYARSLAAEGAAVVVADLSRDAGEQVAKSIDAAGGRAMFVAVDVADPDSTAAMAAATVDQFGGIDYLVNNAAIYGDMKFDVLINVDWDYYRRFMSVNLDGALLCTRAVFRAMHERGGGAIVNQSSTAAWTYSGFYGLAKVGMNGLTQQLAHELGAMNIRVNAIAPGPIDTEATRTAVGDMVKPIVEQLAIKRLGTPDDLVGMCMFLLSDEARWMTGQIVNVDGGQVFRS